ncbi:MAG: SMC-Scp complex subunit ScpB [Christensenellales bacterium]
MQSRTSGACRYPTNAVQIGAGNAHRFTLLVTRSEIEGIKGVSADYSLRTLLQRRLIEPVGRKETIGRPMMYGTTDEFMRHFGLSTLSELPPLPEIEKEEEEMPF